MTKEWANRFAWICTGVVLLIGSSEAAYWTWRVSGGDDFLPFLSMMSAPSAVTLVVCGIALLTLSSKHLLAWGLRCGCAIMMMSVGVWTLYEYGPVHSTRVAGLMSLNSAGAFILSGVILLYMGRGSARDGRMLQGLVWLVVALAAFPLIGHLYGADPIVALLQSKAMSPMTGVAFMVFSTGIFMRFPGEGLLAMFADRGMTGRTLRMMLPMAFIAPVLMEWLEIIGEEHGIFSPEMGSAAMAVSTSALLILVVFRNATSLKRIDVARDEALQMVAMGEKRLQGLLDNIPSIVFIKDRKGRFILLNRQFEVVFHKRAEMIGKTGYDLFSEEQAQILAMNDQSVLESGEAREIEEIIIHPDGSLHTYLTAIFPLWDPLLGENVLCGVALDITQRKEMENKVQELARLKSEFASVVSHELRGPMTVIRGEVELVDDGILGPVTSEQKHHLEIALHSMDRLNRLITDVLDFQKIETGQLDVVPEPIEVSNVVGEIVEGFEATIVKKGIELRSDLPANLPAVMCDKDGFIEVLTNLIDNAIKYTDAGTVDVSAKAMGDRVEISVTDTGIGIPAEHQDRLFQAFSRIHTDGRKADGTGLGLAICKKIVERNGGTIGVKSHAGAGSTFFVTFPAIR